MYTNTDNVSLHCVTLCEVTFNLVFPFVQTCYKNPGTNRKGLRWQEMAQRCLNKFIGNTNAGDYHRRVFSLVQSFSKCMSVVRDDL